MFQKPDPITVQIEDATVFVHPLTAGQYRRLIAYMRSKDADPVHGDFMLLHFSCHDKDGQPLFKTVDDAESITPKQADALIPECVKANRIGSEDEKKVPANQPR